MTDEKWLEAIYVAYWGRAADPEGLDYWLDQWGEEDDDGKPKEAAWFASTFALQDEALDAYEYFKVVEKGENPTSRMRSDFIDSVYENIFNRKPDDDGKDYWKEELEDGNVDPGEFIAAVINSALADDPDGEDAKTVLAKVDVADFITSTIVSKGMDDDEALKWVLGDELKQILADTGPTNKNTMIDEAEDLLNVSGHVVHLTTSTDTVDPTQKDSDFQTTDENDLIQGIVARTGSTLNARDNIDGGEGYDTLKVEMSANFSGFDRGGGLANVEHVRLINTTSKTVEFDADGIKDVEKYTIQADQGPVALLNLGQTDISIDIKDQESGELSLGFTDDAVANPGGPLALNLENAGTEKDEVELTGKNIENLEDISLRVTGTNYINLAAAEQARIAISGRGDIHLMDVGKDLTKLDGSGARGNITADLSRIADAEIITEIHGGRGDDTFTVHGDGLDRRVAITGGQGNDSLIILDPSTRTLIPEMSQVETMEIHNLKKILEFDGTNVSGLNHILLHQPDGGSLLLDDMSLSELNLTLAADDADTGKATVNYDGEGDLTVQTRNNAESDAEDGAELELELTATDITELTVNVSSFTTLHGDLTAAKVKDFVLNVEEDADFSGAIFLDQAEDVKIFAQGALNDVRLDAPTVEKSELTLAEGELTLNAQELTELKVNHIGSYATGPFLLQSSATGLDALTDIYLETDKEFTIAGANLAALTSGEFTQQGSVVIEQAVGAEAENITLNAANLAGTFTATVDQRKDPSQGKGEVEISGSEKSENQITVGADWEKIVVTGGEKKDEFSFVNGDITVTGAGGRDTYKIGFTITSPKDKGESDGKITITDFRAGTSRTLADTLDFSANTLAPFGSGAFEKGDLEDIETDHDGYIFAIKDDDVDRAAIMVQMNDAFGAAGNQKAILLATDRSGDTMIWYVDDSLDGKSDDVTLDDIVLIGVLEGADASAANFVASNFAA